MKIFTSLIIGDLSPEGIGAVSSTDEEVLRVALVELYNDAVRDGGLDPDAPSLDLDAPLSAIEIAIFNWLGRKVVIKETELLVA